MRRANGRVGGKPSLWVIINETLYKVAQELKPNQITLQLKTGQTRKPMQ